MRCFEDAVDTLRALEDNELRPQFEAQLDLVGDFIVMHLIRWPHRIAQRELTAMGRCPVLPETVRDRCREIEQVRVLSAALLAEERDWTQFTAKMQALVLRSLQFALQLPRSLPFHRVTHAAAHVLRECLRSEARRLEPQARQRLTAFLQNADAVHEMHDLLERVGPESFSSQLQAASTLEVRQSLLDMIAVLAAAFHILCTEFQIVRAQGRGEGARGKMYGISVVRESGVVQLTRLVNVGCLVAVEGRARRAVMDYRSVPAAQWEQSLMTGTAAEEQVDCVLLTHHDEPLAVRLSALPIPSSLLAVLLSSTVRGWDVNLRKQDWDGYETAAHSYAIEPQASPAGPVTSRIHLTQAPREAVDAVLHLLANLAQCCRVDGVFDEAMWARLTTTFGPTLATALASQSDAPRLHGWLGAAHRLDCEAEGGEQGYLCQSLPEGRVSVRSELRRTARALVSSTGAETVLHRPLSSVVVSGEVIVGRKGTVQAGEVVVCSVLVAADDLDKP